MQPQLGQLLQGLKGAISRSKSKLTLYVGSSRSRMGASAKTLPKFKDREDRLAVSHFVMINLGKNLYSQSL